MTRIWLGAGLVIAVVAAAVSIWLLRSDDRSDATEPLRADDRNMCTLMGCSSGVAVMAEGLQRDLPEARRLLLCVDDTECSLSRVPGRGSYTNVVYGYEFKQLRQVRVEFSVLGPEAETLRNVRRSARLRPYYPNGEACGGACARLDLLYDLERDALVIDRGEIGGER